MTDGRRRGDEPEGYDWLYGTSSKGVGSSDPTQLLPGAPAEPEPGSAGSKQGPGQGKGGEKGSGQDPEATRVIPRSQVPSPKSSPNASPKSSSQPSPKRATAAPDGVAEKPPKKPRRWRVRPGRIVLLVLLLWLAYLVAVPLIAWNSVSKVDAEPGGSRPADQPGTTYLLVGSDSREGLTQKQRDRLSTGSNAGQRTDTIMLLHTGEGPNLLLSIPRDSIVDIPGHGSGNKINAAYALGGPPLLVQTVELATGIRVDDYVEIGFGGFVQMVNAVGGITICPKTDMVDKLAGLDVKEGCQPANGRKALAYARSRKTQELGDIDRATHQREVVGAIGGKAFSPWTFVNPLRYWQLAFASADSVKVGENVGPVAMGNFALAMRDVNGEDGLTCGVPIADFAVNWDQERAERLFRLIREDRTSEVGDGLCKPSGLAR